MHHKIETATKFFNLMKDALLNGNFEPLQNACKEYSKKLYFSYDDFENKYREVIKRVGFDIMQDEKEKLSFTVSCYAGSTEKTTIEVTCSSCGKTGAYYVSCEPYVRIADEIPWGQCKDNISASRTKVTEVFNEE